MTNFEDFDNGVVLEGTGEVSLDETTTEEIFPLCAGESGADSTDMSTVTSPDGVGEDDRVSGPVACDGTEDTSGTEGGPENACHTDSSEESYEVREEGSDADQVGALASEGDDDIPPPLTMDNDDGVVDDPVERTQEQDSDVSTTDSTPRTSSDIIMIKVMDENLVINESFYPREKIDQPTVKSYVEALRVGTEFPPLVATQIDGKFVIVDGGHRLTALRKYLTEDHRKFWNETHKERVDMKEKKGATDDDLNLPPMPATPPEEVACRIITIPEDKNPILVAYGYNRRHGLRPSAQDQKKTCRAVYKPGMPLTTIAAHLGVSPKAVRSHVSDMVAAYEDERRALILRLAVDGYSNDEIASELGSRYPHAQGTSSSSVSRSIADARDSLEKSRLGQPVKPKKPSNKPGKSGSKSQEDVPPYPPPVSSTGGTGASETTKSETAGNVKTIFDTPARAGAETAAPFSGSSPAQPKTYTGGGSGASQGSAGSGVWSGFVSPTKTEAEPNSTTDGPAGSSAPDSSITPESAQSPRDDTYYMGQLGLMITPYTTWETTEKSIVANLLFFFTDQGDLVLDYSSRYPYILRTVSTAMGRRVHDFRLKGWPRDENPAIVFATPVPVEDSPAVDPDFTRNILHHSLKRAYEKAQPGCRIALLCEDWVGENGETPLVFDFVEILAETGWTLTRAIQAPRPTSIYDKVVSKAEKSRELLDTARYVLIAQKKAVQPDPVAGNDLGTEAVTGSLNEDLPAPDQEEAAEPVEADAEARAAE